MVGERLGEPLIGPGLIVPDAAALTSIEYEPTEDTLYLRVAEAGPAVADVFEDILVVIDPVRRQVVGFDIEGFERSFLPAHPDIADAAKRSAPLISNSSLLMPWWLTRRLRQALAERVPV